MAVTAAPPSFSRSPHLVGLVADVERLASLVAGAPAAERRALRPRVADRAVVATLALDGARGEELPDAAAAARALAAAAPVEADPADRRGTWLDTLTVFDDPTDQQIRALEVLGARAAEAADDLAPALAGEPLATLAELHRRLTRGLVSAQRAGQPRRSEQAVHDGSTGRILFFTADPSAVAREVGLLGAWLGSTGAREHGLIVSGVLHHELLRIHPFDAANGRLARAAARLVLRERGLDPDHLAAPEPSLARDPLGYYEEVASSLRRRDLTIWLERWAEAVADGLRGAARTLGVLEARAAAPARAFAEAEPDFTIADFRAGIGAEPEEARAQLRALLDLGAIRHVPGARGLRFTSALTSPDA